MKWVLLIWIFTGEHHTVKTLDFSSEDRCVAAEVWVMEAGKGNWTKKYTPKARCFQI